MKAGIAFAKFPITGPTGFNEGCTNPTFSHLLSIPILQVFVICWYKVPIWSDMIKMAFHDSMNVTKSRNTECFNWCWHRNCILVSDVTANTWSARIGVDTNPAYLIGAPWTLTHQKESIPKIKELKSSWQNQVPVGYSHLQVYKQTKSRTLNSNWCVIQQYHSAACFVMILLSSYPDPSVQDFWQS